MKKILTVLFLIYFSCLSANATEMVSFMAGRPMHVMNSSGQRRSVHNFGSNAAFLPHNIAATAQRNRAAQREKAITRAINSYANKNNAYANALNNNRVSIGNTPSRLDRSNSRQPARKTYSRGGITYYN